MATPTYTFPSAAFDAWLTTQPEPEDGACDCARCTWDGDGKMPSCDHARTGVDADEDGKHAYCLCCEVVL